MKTRRGLLGLFGAAAIVAPAVTVEAGIPKRRFRNGKPLCACANPLKDEVIGFAEEHYVAPDPRYNSICAPSILCTRQVNTIEYRCGYCGGIIEGRTNAQS